MSLKIRRFSLDSSVSLDGDRGFGLRRGSNKFTSKKSRLSQSLDDARQEIQELNHGLNPNAPIRTIAEENFEPSQELDHSNQKHNKSFHKLFQEIPEEENLTHTFTCALQKEVLYHGKLYVSENYVCFYSSVLLKDTKVVIPAASVVEVKKHNSALSLLSIQTADGEKYSFVSLRNREVCYRLLQSVCSYAQEGSANSSPHLSSADNEVDLEVVSSYSSLDDSIDHELERQDSFDLKNGFPQLPTEGPTRCSSRHESSSAVVSWIWRVIEKVAFLVFHRGIRNLGVLFYIYIMLIILLLLASGYIGLRITALEEQINSLAAPTEWPLHHREYQQT